MNTAKENDVITKVLSLMERMGENINESQTDDLVEYVWLHTKNTGLNVDVFADDGEAYIRNGHPQYLYARNGYNKSVDDFIPFLVSENPRMLDISQTVNLKKSDIEDIKSFIKQNLDVLKGNADMKISHTEFYQNLKPITRQHAGLLMEMSMLRKNESGLPMDVWLDEGATYQSHAPRLKFKASKEQHNSREYSSIILSPEPELVNLPTRTDLSGKELELLRSFVLLNLDSLIELANGKITHDEFLAVMNRL